MTKKLAILGASGHGKVVAEIAEKNGWDEVCFFDVSWPEKKSIGRWTVYGDETQLLKSLKKYNSVFIAIGNNSIRFEKQSMLQSNGAELATVIASTAIVSSDAKIGKGVLVAEGTMVGIGVSISDGVIINTGSIIEHDCNIQNFAHISPGVNLAGNVKVGSLCWIGLGSNIIQGICIGEKAVVGAGSVVINDVLEKQTVVGVPAKVVEKG